MSPFKNRPFSCYQFAPEGTCSIRETIDEQFLSPVLAVKGRLFISEDQSS